MEMKAYSLTVNSGTRNIVLVDILFWYTYFTYIIPQDMNCWQKFGQLAKGYVHGHVSKKLELKKQSIYKIYIDVTYDTRKF